MHELYHATILTFTAASIFSPSDAFIVIIFSFSFLSMSYHFLYYLPSHSRDDIFHIIFVCISW